MKKNLLAGVICGWKCKKISRQEFFILPPANFLFGGRTGKKLNPEKWGNVNERATKFIENISDVKKIFTKYLKNEISLPSFFIAS